MQWDNEQYRNGFFFKSTEHSCCSLLPLDAINFENIATQKRAGLLWIW